MAPLTLWKRQPCKGCGLQEEVIQSGTDTVTSSENHSQNTEHRVLNCLYFSLLVLTAVSPSI